MARCLSVSVEKRNANRTISALLRRGIVRKDLKMRYDGTSVIIPVSESPGNPDLDEEERDFEEREIQVPPVERVNRLLNVDGEHLGFPDKFIKLGDALLLKENRYDPSIGHKLDEVAREFKVKSIYVDCGITGTVERRPDVRRIYGPGGDTIHEEKGILYTFDPEKVMFSPGNVNARILEGTTHISAPIVLDMFAGIGYFSLHAARNHEVEKVYACEINPESFRYLRRNIALNSLESSITPLPGDCRVSSRGITADYIIMGHFDSPDFLSTALLRSRRGTIINMHLLVDTAHLEDHWKDVVSRSRDLGFGLDLHSSRAVKSYGPHLWHMSTMFRVSETVN